MARRRRSQERRRGGGGSEGGRNGGWDVDGLGTENHVTYVLVGWLVGRGERYVNGQAGGSGKGKREKGGGETSSVMLWLKTRGSFGEGPGVG